MSGGLINVGRNFEGEGSREVISSVKISISHKRPEKTMCKNYISGYSYGQCIDDLVVRKMTALLGCVPPYINISSDYKVCDENIMFNNEKEPQSIKKTLLKLVVQSQLFSTVDFEEECQLPCTEMLFDVQENTKSLLTYVTFRTILEIQLSLLLFLAIQ